MADAADKAANCPSAQKGCVGTPSLLNRFHARAALQHAQAAKDTLGEAPAGRSVTRQGALQAVLYVLFAAIATLMNIGTQEAVLRLAPFVALNLSIIAGTATGFIVKYWLDKNWIFFDVSSDRSDEAAKIFTYGLFGILTTLIFWSFELAAWWAFETSTAKYAGAVAGLSVGYALKYMLDRAFVFTGRRR
jgi:putative flippase GtrA